MGSRDWTKVVRLGSKCLHLLSHFPAPKLQGNIWWNRWYLKSTSVFNLFFCSTQILSFSRVKNFGAREEYFYLKLVITSYASHSANLGGCQGVFQFKIIHSPLSLSHTTKIGSWGWDTGIVMLGIGIDCKPSPSNSCMFICITTFENFCHKC